MSLRNVSQCHNIKVIFSMSLCQIFNIVMSYCHIVCSKNAKSLWQTRENRWGPGFFKVFCFYKVSTKEEGQH
jgi:hypothetical protein